MEQMLTNSEIGNAQKNIENASRILTNSQSMYKKASQRLPLGVTSNYRHWGPEKTLYIKKGKGAYIWDVDDNRYLDFRLSYGPIILGHADSRVDNAVANAILDGTCFSLSLPLEFEVTDKISKMCGIDMCRLSTSGCEATMHSLRLARAYTKREKVLFFEGAWHGLHDSVMFNTVLTSDRTNPVTYPTSLGIPAMVKDYAIVLPFNDPEILENTIKKHGHEIAAIIVEPILGNCGGIMPQEGWLQFIRKICDEHGIVLIMDEVKTGFRIAKGGAQEYFNVKADLVAYAKAMANGYPIAAFGGKKEIMKQIGNGVMHGGTYNGNRVGLAAANATLDILNNTDALSVVYERGESLKNVIREVLVASGLPFVFSGHPSMFMFWFSEEAPKECRDWLKSDHTLYDKVANGLIERGVMPEPSSREPWFMCASHTDADFGLVATALEDSIKHALGRKQSTFGN